MTFRELVNGEGEMTPLMRAILLSGQIFYMYSHPLSNRLQAAYMWSSGVVNNSHDVEGISRAVGEIRLNLEAAESILKSPLFLFMGEDGLFGQTSLLPWQEAKKAFETGVGWAMQLWDILVGRGQFPQPETKVEDKKLQFLLTVNPDVLSWLVCFLVEQAIGSARQAEEDFGQKPVVRLELAVEESRVVFSVEDNGLSLPKEFVEGLRQGKLVFPEHWEELYLKFILLQLTVGEENLVISSGESGMGNIIKVYLPKWEQPV